jgi:hypothetical protein
VNGLSGNGCPYSALQTVTVTPLPPVSASANQTLLCKGKSSTLTVTGANSYTWSTTSHATVITVSPSVTTSYTVTGTDTVTGCSATSSLQVTVQNCQGLETNNESSGIVIFPNPSSGEFDINVGSTFSLGRLIVQDVGGKILIDQKAGGDSIFHVSNLMSGLYLVVFIRDGNYSVGKIRVE